MYTDDLTLSLLSDDSVLANIAYEQHKIKTIKNQFFISKQFNIFLKKKLTYPHNIVNEDIFSFDGVKFPVFSYPLQNVILTENPIVILNREKYEQEIKQKQHKEYMDAFNSGNIYTVNEDLIKKHREILKKIQLKNMCNIFFIDSFKDLELLCKTIYHKEDKVFYLKTKSFADKQEHLQNLLVKINGLTEHFAKKIAEEFKSLGIFMLRGRNFNFHDIKIKNRRLPESTIENINKLFFS